jgi:hypothetical protein
VPEHKNKSGYWISKCCGAMCSVKHNKVCWNCQSPRDRTAQAKTFETECHQCGLKYLGVMGAGEELSMCPHYFEHSGENAYYPPNLVPIYLLWLNGYDYDELKKKVVKRATA